MNLIQTNGIQTMSSMDLMAIVNSARKEYGETEVRRNDFVARCKDELDGDHYETFVVKEPSVGTSACTVNVLLKVRTTLR